LEELKEGDIVGHDVVKTEGLELDDFVGDLEGTFDRVGSTLVGNTDGDAVGRGADGDRVVNDRVWLMKANGLLMSQ